VDVDDVVEEADLEEVDEAPAPARPKPAPSVPPAPPAAPVAVPPAAPPIAAVAVAPPPPLRPTSDAEAPPSPEVVEPSTDLRAADSVEELDADDLVTTNEVPSLPKDGVIEAAIAAAQKAIADGGGPVRVKLYETEIAALGTDDKPTRALYEHEIGELTEAAGDESAAVKAYAKALQSDPTLKSNLWAIRRVFQRRALWPNLLKLLDAEIRFARTEPEKAELWVEKGQVYEDKLKQVDPARDCYQKATEAHPGSLAAWLALEKVYARAGDLAGLARALRGQASAVNDPARKSALLLDLARLQESVDGGSVEAAIELCREAHQAGADPERALDQLERTARRAGRVEDVLWALDARALLAAHEAEAASAGDRLLFVDKQVAIRRRQADLVREVEGGLPRAWEYLTKAFELKPDEPLLVRDLAEAAEALGRWDDLATFLERRIEAAPAELKPSLQLERADALRRAGRAQDADTVEAEVARDLPQHLGLQISRERDAMRAGDWGRLASLYLAEGELALAGKTATGEADPMWAAIAFTQAGTLLGDRSARDAEAVAALLKAREARPEYTPATDALERLYARTGKHAEHAALIEEELKKSPSADRARRLCETLIAVRESGLDDPAGAAQAARRLCELRPDDVRLRLRVIELDRAAARWADVAQGYAELASVLPPEQGDRKLEAILARADVLERRLGDDDGAQKAYREALAIRAGEPRAVDGFERISRRRSGATSGPRERPTPEAWDDLAQALRREAEGLLEPARVASVLLKLGEIHERERQSPADAVQTYRDLLDRVPGNAAALRGLARAYAQLGQTADQAQALDQEVEAIEAASQPLLLTRLGELYEDRIKADDVALDAYGRAGDNPHAVMGRFRVAVRKREPEAITQALAALEALLGSGEGGAKAALLDERAWAERVAGDVEAAERLVREALQQSTGVSAQPRLQRARLAARNGQAGEVGDALEALAANATDPALQAVLYRRAGLIALGAGAHDLARSRIQKGHALVPSDPELLVALADLETDPDVLKARVSLSDGHAQLEWIVERAEALEVAGRLADAARETMRALTIDPRHVGALELLRRLAEAGGDVAGRARAAARLGAELQDQERSAARYREAGASFEKAALREEAAAAWRAALDRTPLDGDAFNHARTLLAALYAEKRQPGPLVELYTHRLQHLVGAQHRDDRAQLLLDRAQLYADEGDRDAAEDDLRAILRDHPEHLGAMRRLAEVLAQTAHGRAEAVQLLERYLTLETATEHRRATLLRLAELEESPGGRPERAVEQLEAAIALAPSPQAALGDHERLAQLHLRLRSWQRAIDVLKKMAELSTDAPARARVELRIATVSQDGFGDSRAAIEALQRALKHEPVELEALEKMVAYAEKGQVVQLDLDDKLGRALDTVRARLGAGLGGPGGDPKAADHFLALVRLYGWRSDEDARSVAVQGLKLAQGEKPDTPTLWRDDAIDPAKELLPAGWELVHPEAARSVALEIWRTAAEASMKLYGPSTEQLGVGKADRMNAKNLPPGWARVDKIARALGCAGYELYAAKDREQVAIGASGDAPVLAAGAAFAERLQPRLRFRVARKLALLRDRLGPVADLDEEELSIFFAACAKVAEVARPPSLAVPSEAKVEERAKQVAKALGRKERKALQAIGARFASLPTVGEWKRAVLDGASRAALVVGGDLAAALAELGLAFTDPRAGALVRFAVSDEYFALRRDMGLRS
jgi:tetratricopeptide (TPR) repeat protein